MWGCTWPRVWGCVVVREKRILTIRKRLRERKRSHVLRVVRRNSCQPCRPIFYFVPEETQRHLCHMPKTRYVLADYGWSPPCSVSKPFIETINERDLLNSTAPLFPPPPSRFFFRRWQRALRLSKSASEKLPIRTCMASDTHTVQPRRFPILSFFCLFVFFVSFCFFFFRSSKWADR